MDILTVKLRDLLSELVIGLKKLWIYLKRTVSMSNKKDNVIHLMEGMDKLFQNEEYIDVYMALIYMLHYMYKNSSEENLDTFIDKFKSIFTLCDDLYKRETRK